MNEAILVAEDDSGLVTVLSDRLKLEGYRVESVVDGVQALDRLTEAPFDLLVLDIMLPKKNGWDVCRDLRQLGFTTPVLILSARGDIVDKVIGLKLGADDYLAKPFQMQELLARIEALLRRAARPANAALIHDVGGARVDLRRTRVTRDGQPVSLSAREFQLLRYFVEHRGETLSRAELLREVWGYAGVPSTRTVDVHVAGLRQKLEPEPANPKLILTVPGLGYKLAE